MVRLQDKLYSVDLFSAKLRLIGGGPADGLPATQQAPARQGGNDAAGLEWNGDLDGPALLPLQESGSEVRQPAELLREQAVIAKASTHIHAVIQMRTSSERNPATPDAVAARLRGLSASEELHDR